MAVNKKRLIILPLFLGFFVSQVASAGAGFGIAGSEQNPVITKSYADKVLSPLKNEIKALQTEINTLKGAGSTPVGGTGSFKDVPSSYWAYSDIKYMVDKGVIKGLGDGNFGAVNPTKRSELAVMLVKALNLSVTGAKADFVDVSPNHWATSYIATAQSKGIISGFPGGEFRPDDYVTRGQMAVMVARAYDLNRKNTVKDFGDVTKDYWAYSAIMTLADNSISKGYDNGTFRPVEPVKRAEVAVFLAKAMDPSRRN